MHQFSVYTTDFSSNVVGSWLIDVFGELDYNLFTFTRNFTLTIVDPCPNLAYTVPTTPVSVIYYLTDTDSYDLSSYFVDPWTLCPKTNSVTMNGGSLDTNLFNYDSSNWILTISSSNTGYNGQTFSIVCTAYLTANPSAAV